MVNNYQALKKQNDELRSQVNVLVKEFQALKETISNEEENSPSQLQTLERRAVI